jgi:hypothetical protein
LQYKSYTDQASTVISFVKRDVSGRKVVSFSDFYDIAAISAEQTGLNIISMEQFLEREALNGNLKGQYPPNNRINWDNQRLESLWAYIGNVTESFDWHPNHCILVFPRDGSDGQDLYAMMDDILEGKDGRPFPNPSEYQGKATRVDAPTMERLREALGGRSDSCICFYQGFDLNSLELMISPFVLLQKKVVHVWKAAAHGT